MNILAINTALLLVAAATVQSSKEKTVFTKELFVDDLVIHGSYYDIVQIVVPMNKLNYNDDMNLDGKSSVIFFVEVEDNDFVDYEYKGLYIYNKGNITKLLDNGRDAAAVNGDSDVVYFAATDGLYVYDSKGNKAVKYGNLEDNIVSIAITFDSNLMYIITDSHELFEVTQNGTKKIKIEGVMNAKKMVLDYSNHIYYYDYYKQPYVINAEGIKKIAGLPENPLSVALLKPPFILEDCVPYVVDDKVYYLYANGTIELSEFEIRANPSAYAMESTFIQFYAYEKKIYAVNLLGLLLAGADVTDEDNLFNEDTDDYNPMFRSPRIQRNM